MISLSNLLKNAYVVRKEDEKRVLNFNQRFDNLAMMESTKKEKNSESSQDLEIELEHREKEVDGFLAGLNVDVVEFEPVPTAEEILEEANKEKESILEDAKTQAMEMIENAKKEAEEIFTTAKEDGFQEGKLEAEKEIEQYKKQLIEEKNEEKNHFEKQYIEKLEKMEEELVDAMIPVFHKVFQVQFDDKKDIVLHLIKNTILDIGNHKEFHIRTSAENADFLNLHLEELKEKLGTDLTLDVICDASLTEDACMIETDTAVFDCSIDVELSNLEKDIRSLCGGNL